MERETVGPRFADEAALKDFLSGPAPDRPIGLSLAGDHWGPDACRLIAQSRLEFVWDSISIRGARIGDDGLDWLATHPSLAGLRSLAAEHSGVTDDSVMILALSPQMVELRSLYLCNRGGVTTGLPNRISDRGAISLACSAYLKSLEMLDLWNTEVGDEGFLSLFSSSGLPRLSSLTAWETRLTAEGAERVKAAARQKWEQSHAKQLWEESHGKEGLITWSAVHTDYDQRSANPWDDGDAWG